MILKEGDYDVVGQSYPIAIPYQIWGCETCGDEREIQYAPSGHAYGLSSDRITT